MVEVDVKDDVREIATSKRELFRQDFTHRVGVMLVWAIGELGSAMVSYSMMRSGNVGVR